MKKALITGITGQDGSYLAEFLLEKEYEEIEEEYGIKNVHYQFKKIRKFIRTELPKRNAKFVELVRNIDRKL